MFKVQESGAVSKLAHLLGIQRSTKGFKETKQQPASRRNSLSDGITPVVFFSNLEHHSNCVFWREMDCISVVCIMSSRIIPIMQCVDRVARNRMDAGCDHSSMKSTLVVYTVIVLFTRHRAPLHPGNIIMLTHKRV